MSLHTEMKCRPANWLFSKTLFFFKNGSIEIRIAKFNDGLSEKKKKLGISFGWTWFCRK